MGEANTVVHCQYVSTLNKVIGFPRNNNLCDHNCKDLMPKRSDEATHDTDSIKWQHLQFAVIDVESSDNQVSLTTKH